ncbi:hypothetical protein [Streptomyces sp. TSRI0107]|uniref:hypothetical protein n=1 Tax=Streptomyces sp. TSRI0107 TaxID=1703942 RepID=UPI0013019958|nr:hypothetical protein [Streptomyces sp. TSRI0107]
MLTQTWRATPTQAAARASALEPTSGCEHLFTALDEAGELLGHAGDDFASRRRRTVAGPFAPEEQVEAFRALGREAEEWLHAGLGQLREGQMAASLVGIGDPLPEDLGLASYDEQVDVRRRTLCVEDGACRVKGVALRRSGGLVRIQPGRPGGSFFRCSGQADVNAFCAVRNPTPYFR